jgi:hypothetical protein
LAGFTWIHYYCRRHEKTMSGSPRSYDLFKLEKPMREARTLHMLVVPLGSPGVLLEVASGLALSPAAALVEGALRGGIPTLFEASFLGEWCEAGGEEHGERWKAVRRTADSLAKRGMEFLGLEMKSPDPSDPGICRKPDSIRLGGGGWLSWREVAPLVIEGQIKTVLLADGTKLTPEAADRLLKLNVQVEEVL